MVLLMMIRVYLRLLGAHLRAVLEYRYDALLTIGATVLGQGAGLVFVGAVFAQVPELAGWTRWEVVCVYAMVLLAEGVGSLFFEGTWQLAGMINGGDLDYLLVRPYPVTLQVTGSALGVNGLGNVLLGGVLLVGAVGQVDVDWQPVTIGWAVVLLVSALATKVAINLATNSVAFWLLSPSSSLAAGVHVLGDLARYPITVYGVGLRVLLTLLPVTFVGYFPAAALLGKGVSATVGLLTPVVAVLCLIIARQIFKAGLRRYESAGS
ncbi:ABC-2 family transporter protein [Micromonospora sp. NPDC047074]|uniref:ABC transporter permease n=1 Tax=Micromonospora sp. NPDC047074 TaxID=3154339 RepID=UPI0033EA89F6